MEVIWLLGRRRPAVRVGCAGSWISDSNWRSRARLVQGEVVVQMRASPRFTINFSG